MTLEIDTKSNSIEVALSVFEIPKAVSKSGSVPQVVSPSFKILILVVFPAELALPVESIIPFSKGKLVLARSKYPKLENPFTLPLIEDDIFVISTQPSARLFSISVCTVCELSIEILCEKTELHNSKNTREMK